jgi:hypothetical protein
LVAIADLSAPNGGHAFFDDNVIITQTTGVQTTLDDDSELALQHVDALPRKPGSYRSSRGCTAKATCVGLRPVMRSPTAVQPTDEGRRRATDGDEPGQTGGRQPVRHRRSDLISNRDALQVLTVPEENGERLRRSNGVSWAWLDLNQRPHPYQIFRSPPPRAPPDQRKQPLRQLGGPNGG